MAVTFDPDKSDRNGANRELPFHLVDRIDWPTALIWEDCRHDYGELRLLVVGYIEDRLHVAVVTPRATDLRVISLRKANRKETRLYEQEVAKGGRAR